MKPESTHPTICIYTKTAIFQSRKKWILKLFLVLILENYFVPPNTRSFRLELTKSGPVNTKVLKSQVSQVPFFHFSQKGLILPFSLYLMPWSLSPVCAYLLS